MKPKITPRIEAYLVAILQIQREHIVARIKDIAYAMDVAYTSASAAVNKMHAMGLVHHEKYGYVELTDQGKAKAEEALRRSKTVYDFLTLVLQLDPKVAWEEAHYIEHQVSEDTLGRLAGFIELVRTCPHSRLYPDAQRVLSSVSERQSVGRGLGKPLSVST